LIDFTDAVDAAPPSATRTTSASPPPFWKNCATAEGALELAEALDSYWLVGGSAARSPDEGGDRCSDARDGAHATRNFLDINARIADRD
jgi:hypothetical protein